MTKPVWTTALPDWERRIVAGESLIAFPPLFPDEAEAALEQFKALHVVDVAGKPTFGEVGRQWIFDLVSTLFGSYDAESGRRLIKEYFVCVSKKNGKSTLAAGIMLTALTRNWRDSGEFLILAPTKEVAGNSFTPIRDMIREDEELSDLLQIQEHLKTVTHRTTKAELKVVAADSATVSGKKGIFVLVDELHEFGKQVDAGNMLREATGGLISRPEGCTIYLTTQSDQPPAGVFSQKLLYARAVRDGTVEDPAFLPMLYEFPEKMLKEKEYLDFKNAYITNPNFGASVDIETLEREKGIAEHGGEAALQGFNAKFLNVELGIALRSNRWAGAEFWEQQGCKEGLSLDDLLTRCEVIVAGVDGGGLDDLLGLAILGREAETRKWLLWTHAWAHPLALERRKSEAERYRDFQREGSLTIVAAVGDDVKEVGEIILKCENSGLLDRIGVDQAGIGDIVDELTGRGIEIDRIVGISQGWRLNAAIKTTERKLAAGELIHGDQSMMNWCAGNARVEPKGNAILITKQVSGSGKIDPLMAALNTVSLMALNPESKGGKSFWEV